MSKKRGFGSLLAGIGIGVGLGVLFAPQSGEQTRKDLKKKMDELVTYLKGLDYNEVKDNLIEKVENLKKELEDLDKEKVLEIAKVKAEEIKEKAEELYRTAVAQGKPVIEKAAKEIKAKTVVVLKGMIDKLEEEQKPIKKPKKA
ncbi:MAG: YtxH domain-containing protein [Bacilli bacterium]|nr:YtxH domain-containing protein [Bacilli bacterium]